MPGRDPDLRYGRLVWATLTDRRGKRADHPAIIITPNEELSEDEELAVMAVTTSYGDPPPPHHIELPWNPDPRKVGTRLSRRSAAVVNWLNFIHPRDIRRLAGDVPKPLMSQIQAALNALGEQRD